MWQPVATTTVRAQAGRLKQNAGAEPLQGDMNPATQHQLHTMLMDQME